MMPCCEVSGKKFIEESGLVNLRDFYNVVKNFCTEKINEIQDDQPLTQFINNNQDLRGGFSDNPEIVSLLKTVEKSNGKNLKIKDYKVSEVCTCDCHKKGEVVMH